MTRQVVEGVGEYLQASQLEWDIFIEEDFRARIENIKSGWAMALSPTMTIPKSKSCWPMSNVPIVGVGGSYHQPEHYRRSTISPPTTPRWWESAFLHLKEKGVHRFAFYGLPTSSGKRWAVEREYAFCQLVAKEKYRGVVYQGLETAPENWQHAQNRLADWPANPAAANRHHRRHPTPAPATSCRPASCCISRCQRNCALSASITRELTPLSLSRRPLLCRPGAPAQMGLSGRQKLLHRLLNNEALPLQRQLIPPMRVVERTLHRLPVVKRSLRDTGDALHSQQCLQRHQGGNRCSTPWASLALIWKNASKRRSGRPSTRWIHSEKLEKARSLLVSTSLSINEISQMCGYPSLQYSLFGV
ncbi:Xylose activator XylR (AraC family) [Klebsiella pneumoniae]|uniref:Xylose activator XylR (AraC family) n=1 Tax=Klebsiella pneumoniae TaxID=573 RepID=A0A2X3C8F6_KLEPN|nr:Xylose activator XylR (AraC family) [Klebsiella pneumoniae]